MAVHTAYRAFLLVFFGAGAFVVYSGLRLKYYGTLGPGPGFFPVWIGSGLMLACGAALVQSWIDKPRAQPFFGARDAAVRVMVVMLSLAALWLGLKFAGFRLSMLVFVLLVPRVFGPQSAALRVAVALLLSFGVGHLFEKWLLVELPAPAIEALRSLGL